MHSFIYSAWYSSLWSGAMLENSACIPNVNQREDGEALNTIFCFTDKIKRFITTSTLIIIGNHELKMECIFLGPMTGKKIFPRVHQNTYYTHAIMSPPLNKGFRFHRTLLSECGMSLFWCVREIRGELIYSTRLGGRSCRTHELALLYAVAVVRHIFSSYFYHYILINWRVCAKWWEGKDWIWL